MNSFRVVTSDWHPRLLHGVALRLNGGRERERLNDNETRTGCRLSTELFLFVPLDFYREFWQISSTRPSYRN